MKALLSSPLATATAQAVALSFLSNLIGQAIDNRRSGRPLTYLDLAALLRFVAVSILTAPPNYCWQVWLEKKLPGRPRAATEKEKRGILSVQAESASEGEDINLMERGGRQVEDVQGRERLDWKNTLKKWFIDCMTVGAVVNTIAFLVLMGLFKGKTSEQIVEAVRSETIPIIVAGYKIWPIASIISFSLIPVEKRIVFLSAIGLCWGVYLSLIAARE